MARDPASQSDVPAHRLFVAVPIPEQAADTVEAAFGPWRAVFSDARWVPRTNWHVTVRFLGATPPRLVPWIRRRLMLVMATALSFETRVCRVGAFPSPGQARVLWAGLDDAEGRLATLAGEVGDSLRSEFEPDARPFTPHLTVARSDRPLTLPASFPETPLDSAPFTVDRVVLMRSHPRRPAPLYESVQTHPFMGGR